MKRSRLKPVSEKMRQQLVEERKFKQELLVRCKGKCEICFKLPDWRGLSKHEIIKRSHGGNPLDPLNCLLLCGKCHSAEGGIKEV